MRAVADDAFDLDLAAATLRANAGDVAILLRLLAEQLGDALGGRLTIERAGGLLRRPGGIRALTVAVGDDDLRAEVHDGALRCTVAHSSAGIRIRSEPVSPDEWLRRLLSALQAEAAHSDATRAALERIVTGGGEPTP